MPDSQVNRDFFINQQARKIETDDLPYGKSAKNPMLEKLARKQPYYKRNEARICSFFVKGTCNRGDECPFRHELPQTGEMAKQNLRDRFHGVNDPVANKMARRANEQLTLKIPEDKSITTLYVGGVDSALVGEIDLRQTFSAFGELRTVKVVEKQSCAFVVFKERGSAEAAAEKLYKSLKINGVKLRVQWGQKMGNSTERGVGQGGISSSGSNVEKDPLAAPGGKVSYGAMNPMSVENAPVVGDRDSGAVKGSMKGKGKGKMGSSKW